MSTRGHVRRASSIPRRPNESNQYRTARDDNRIRDVNSVAGIVLAAGDSSRMGTNKLLLDLQGTPVLRRVTTRALEADLSPVIVVLGFEADRVQKVLAGLAIETATNTDYRRGMVSSARVGLERLPPEASAAVVLLGDMPLVTSEMIATLVAQYRMHRVPLVTSRFGDVGAPPTLFDRSLFDEFASRMGHGAVRDIVHKYAKHAMTADFPATALADLDSPDDYERLKSSA